MSLLDDFKKFAFKGNVIDLAVGVVIGAAFGKIVSALVADLIMPVVALVMPSGDWRENGLILRHAADPKNNVVLKYGDFMGAILDFLIVAFVLFILVSKIIKAAEGRFHKQPTNEPPATKECPFCLEMVPFKAKRCRACTSELPVAA
jgi:large conductance mechanosensitive channel